MEVKAKAKSIPVSARKARLVADMIRGKGVSDALETLEYSQQKSAGIIGKVLKSAIANSEHNNGMDVDTLYVSQVYVDEGVTLKRFRPRAKGRADRIFKRTCHVTLAVSDDEK